MLVIEIIQGKTTVAEASRSFDFSPSEIEGWVADARRGMENSLRANPLDIREQYEKQLKDLREAHGEAMPELRARKNTRPCCMHRATNDPEHPSGPFAERVLWVL
ncbi:transposase [Pseudogemmobacter bohemicus]|uniref:transposase n=1 Tax=Pseudogemmobacter bohemicus TaxID=2250708 RepID=UPI001E34535F|nr:transposase [Pseudogemmobacter bohemicus]